MMIRPQGKPQILGAPSVEMDAFGLIPVDMSDRVSKYLFYETDYIGITFRSVVSIFLAATHHDQIAR